MATELTTIDDRRAGRQALIPSVYQTKHEQLACELAMHVEDPVAVFARYDYTPEQAAVMIEQPGFIALLERVEKEIRETGLSFKLKARAMAEGLLPEVYDMSTDPLVSSAVRLDGVKWVAKMAGFEPKEKDEGKTGGGFSLSITFAGQAPVQVVNSEPLLIEQEN